MFTPPVSSNRFEAILFTFKTQKYWKFSGHLAIYHTQLNMSNYFLYM